MLKFECYEQGFLPLTDLSLDAASDLIDPGFPCISPYLRVSSHNLIILTILVQGKLLTSKIVIFYRVFKLRGYWLFKLKFL